MIGKEKLVTLSACFALHIKKINCIRNYLLSIKRPNFDIRYYIEKLFKSMITSVIHFLSSILLMSGQSEYSHKYSMNSYFKKSISTQYCILLHIIKV